MTDTQPNDHFFRLTIHGLSGDAAMELAARYSRTLNADIYRDFMPGTLECDSYKWVAGSPLTLFFRAHVPIVGAEGGLDERVRFESLVWMPFGDLPDGDWEEIPPR